MEVSREEVRRWSLRERERALVAQNDEKSVEIIGLGESGRPNQKPALFLKVAIQISTSNHVFFVFAFTEVTPLSHASIAPLDGNFYIISLLHHYMPFDFPHILGASFIEIIYTVI